MKICAKMAGADLLLVEERWSRTIYTPAWFLCDKTRVTDSMNLSLERSERRHKNIFYLKCFIKDSHNVHVPVSSQAHAGGMRTARTGRESISSGPRKSLKPGSGTAVSLHSHTLHSREPLDFFYRIAKHCAPVRWALRRMRGSLPASPRRSPGPAPRLVDSSARAPGRVLGRIRSDQLHGPGAHRFPHRSRRH